MPTDPHPTASGSPLDARAARALDWAIDRLRVPVTSFAPASADASFRRYFRLESGLRSWILMDAPPEREDVAPFLEVAARLARWGLRVPQVLQHDASLGFLLLTDLGTRTYLEVLDESNADRLMGGALEALLRMQSAAVTDPTVADLPRYDAALLRHELRLFPDWFLARERGAAAQDGWATFDAVVAPLVEHALGQPPCFVHRDFMPRNLMAGADQPGILDFQDAVVGPVCYDPLCLFKDAFLSWPEPRVHDWLEDYRRAAEGQGIGLPAGDAEFRRALDWVGLQRHLKVIGIFSRLKHRDGKPQYADDIPRFLEYVRAVLPRHPELAPLWDWWRRHVEPEA